MILIKLKLIQLICVSNILMIIKTIFTKNKNNLAKIIIFKYKID